jgi:alkylresorcinol/alkylpyrone synthase
MTESEVRIERVAVAYPDDEDDQRNGAELSFATASALDGGSTAPSERSIWLATPAWLRRRLEGMATRQQAAGPDSVSSSQGEPEIEPASVLAPLASIEGRNRVYLEAAPVLAEAVVRRLLRPGESEAVRCLVTSSSTGFHLPGWTATLVDRLPLDRSVRRLPLTEAGCAGAALALIQAANHVRLNAGSGLAVALELSSLANDVSEAGDGNGPVPPVLGDGAGAAYLSSGAGAGVEVIDSSSSRVASSQNALAVRLSDPRFYPVVSRDLRELLVDPTIAAIRALLHRHALELAEVSAWLVHPLSTGVLIDLQRQLEITNDRMRWSRAAQRAEGDLSAVAFFEMLGGYLQDAGASPGWAVLAAFGPGLTIDLLLLRRA